MKKKTPMLTAPMMLSISVLHAHPRNYNEHLPDQLEHIKESIREHGIYRNIVIAKDNTILAGHGVVEAAIDLGMTELPCIRLDVDPEDPRALKVLTGDNEIAHLGFKDDRVLSELLKEIKENDTVGLLGTGYDEMMLANLLFVSRPKDEIADFNAAAEWVGMPEYDPGSEPLKVVVSFRNKEDRQLFAEKLGYTFTEKTRAIWFPEKGRADVASVGFESGE